MATGRTIKPAPASAPFRAGKHLRDESEIAAYIEAMLEEGKAQVVPVALRAVADAVGGMAALAERTGLSRETLYRTLSDQGESASGHAGSDSPCLRIAFVGRAGAEARPKGTSARGRLNLSAAPRETTMNLRSMIGVTALLIGVVACGGKGAPEQAAAPAPSVQVPASVESSPAGRHGWLALPWTLQASRRVKS